MTEIDTGARAWLFKTARKHYWRVASWYEFDDLVQDGFLCYTRVIAKYEERDYVTRTGVITKKSRRVRSRKHIMSLFKVLYTTHINDLAKQRTINAVELLAFDFVTNPNVDDVWDDVVTDGLDLMEFERVISEAPNVLQRLLRAIMTDGSEFVLAAPYRVMPTGRETTNERLCKLIGEDPGKADLAKLLRQYLSNEPLAA